MQINPIGGCHWEKLTLKNIFSFNSGFWGGGRDAWVWMHSLSYGIRGSSESCYEHNTVHWMTRWPFLGKGKKKILFSGTKIYKCISLLFLGYTKFIHIKKEHYSQIRERRRKARKKNLKTSVQTLVWTNKGLIFTSKKVKVTRAVLTVSLYGDKRIHHKASSACITIGSWLENGWVQLTMKNELPLCLNKKTPQPDLTRPEAQPHSSRNVWQRTECEFQFILHIWAHTKAYMVLIKIKDIFSHLKEQSDLDSYSHSEEIIYPPVRASSWSVT